MYIKEPEREIPVIKSVDVAVCGGGPAGWTAAVAAARGGAETLLIERYGFLGGMATLSLVSPISKFNFEGRRIIGGIPLQFVGELEKLGGAVTRFPSGNILFDPEVYKIISQRMVVESGVSLLFHSYFAGCLLNRAEGEMLTHLIVENKSGRQAIAAQYVIDGAGDGDVAWSAGVPCQTEAEELQPLTLWFRLGGVDTVKLENLHPESDNTRYFNQRVSAFLKDLSRANRADVPQFGGPWIYSNLRPGEVTVNMTRCPGNGVEAFSLTAAEVKLREDLFSLVKLLQENFSEFQQCHLIDSGVQAGVRETRRIEGLYRMTAEDILAPRDFPDAVARGAHPIDIHKATGEGQEVRFARQAYAIPYRTLIPKGKSNLLVAGRCVAADREASASIRVQATAMALGEAAGTAAALCRQNKIHFPQLDGAVLRRRLEENGAYLP